MPPKAANKGARDWKEDEQERIADVIRELSKKAPAQVAPHLKKHAPHLALVAVYCMAAMPYIVKACTQASEFFQSLPEKIVYASLGFAMCFFGGTFPATIAAVEAFRLCGGSEAKKCLGLLYEEYQKVKDADAKESAASNKKAEDLTPQELITKKTQLVLRTVEPEVVSRGIVGMYTAWIAVVAVLKVQFARTVTLGARIGESAYTWAGRYEPALSELVPEEYRKWVPVCMRWACKVLAITIAWWIQRVVSAVHSAIKGGLLFGHYLVEFLHEKKIVNFKPEQVWLDEAIGWGVALVGLMFQFSWGFSLPFPLNLLLMPLRFVEAFIIWSVAGASDTL